MTSEGIDYNRIVGIRYNCVGCTLEQFKLISYDGITHSGLNAFKSSLVCKKCNSGDRLEFLPIYKGESLEEVVNGILLEICELVDKQKKAQKQLTIPNLEQELTKKYHFKSIKDTGELYYYNEKSGIYLKNAEWLVEQECMNSDPEMPTKTVTEIKNHIIYSNYSDRRALDPNIEWLCCKDVMINLMTGETKPHSPEFMATVQIPHYFNYFKSPCVPQPTKILRFLHQVISSEDVQTILDFLSYCLWRKLPYHRWLLLNGSGRNGKGVTTNLIKHFLGRQNVSSESLHRILENTFAAANLFGKMANIDADLSSETLKRTGELKKLTGGDEISGEFKFKTAFGFDNYAKFLFSANKIPVTPDETDAFFARPLIINFPNQFLGDKANPDLINELTSETEMSALLRLLVKRLPRILQSGISYVGNHSIEDNYIKYIQSSDPIRLFIETAIQRKVGNHEFKNVVYESYSRFCNDKHVGRESSDTFSRRLTKGGFSYKLARIQKTNTRDYVWADIALKDWKKPDEGQEVLI